MKVGDLVRFESSVAAWSARYSHRNPGLVIEQQEKYQPTLGKTTKSMKVLWSNGETSYEHAGYLNTIEKR